MIVDKDKWGILKLNFKNCVVTGGSGFIGSHIVKRLVSEKFNQTWLQIY